MSKMKDVFTKAVFGTGAVLFLGSGLPLGLATLDETNNMPGQKEMRPENKKQLMQGLGMLAAGGALMIAGVALEAGKKKPDNKQDGPKP